MADVLFSEELDERFMDSVRKALQTAFGDCRKVSVKIHFGEPGNDKALTPDMIRPFTDLLEGKELTLYDSSVAYPGPRNNPAEHMQVAKDKGFDRIGMINTEDDFVKVKMSLLEYDVARPLVDADAVLVISHFKGHECSGFGGAIKNLGMGALSKESKDKIHDGSKPVYKGGCIRCGTCARVCPAKGIEIEDRPIIKTCYGCSICIIHCPEKVLTPKVALFDTLLAEGAFAAHKSFKRVYYINIIKNITKACDCRSDPGDIIAEDIGFTASNDPVAIDLASYDLVIKEAGDVFLKKNWKSGTQQVQAAAEYGMGSVDYNLVHL